MVIALAAPPDVLRRYKDAGFLVFEDGDYAISAISALAGFAETFAHAAAIKPPGSASRPSIFPALPPTLDEHSAKALLAATGIPVLPEKVVANGAEVKLAAAEMGCPWCSR